MSNENTVSKIKHLFLCLDPKGRTQMLQELLKIKDDSPQKKHLNPNGIVELYERMKNETFTIKNYNPPHDINNSSINLIIRDAVDLGCDANVVSKLELMAYHGIIEWANDFGYLSDQNEEFAVDHLENYINLVKTNLSKEEIDKLLKQEHDYIERKNNDNFYSDYINETFEKLTGLPL